MEENIKIRRKTSRRGDSRGGKRQDFDGTNGRAGCRDLSEGKISSMADAMAQGLLKEERLCPKGHMGLTLVRYSLARFGSSIPPFLSGLARKRILYVSDLTTGLDQVTKHEVTASALSS